MPLEIVTGDSGVARAAESLRSGRLAVIPTETVYGLGADAGNPAAVRAIFTAKGRPVDNPLIVHIADIQMAEALAARWPESAVKLAEACWPGPLTLVVEHAGGIAAEATAGGPTVGLRIPDHLVALAVLRAAKVPVAAPSANRSERLSPTTAEAVLESLPGESIAECVPVVDGGPCRVGIESTVVDVTCDPPRILRPGMISRSRIEEILGVAVGEGGHADSGPVRSPGQRLRHYAPSVPVVLVDAAALSEFAFGPGDALLWRTAWPGPSVARVADPGAFAQVSMPLDVGAYAAALYSALRALDRPGVRRIVVEAPPSSGSWNAVADRLRRAAVPEDAPS